MEPTEDPDATSPRLHALLELAERIGYSFQDIERLERALVHASMGNAGKENYERLEFLGDAVLGFLVADHLFHQEPEIPEGELTDRRAKIVSRRPLADVARRLGLATYVEAGRGLRDTDLESPRIQADLVEAILGAVYLDGGISAARDFVRDHVLEPLMAEAIGQGDRRDPKSRLLHLAQSLGLGQPEYRVVHAEGPDHERVFTVVVSIGDTEYATGRARSKQAAEMAAAEDTLRQGRALHEAAGSGESR